MKFIKRHEPKNINELVFHDKAVGSLIAQYAQGLRDKHLLLFGPAGSGKSIAAKMILDTCVVDLANTSATQPINGREFTADNFDQIYNDWSYQLMQGAARGYTVIDEVDFLSTHMQQKLRALIDTTEIGTIIATTNNLHKLDEPFKDRFRLVPVERPTAIDWTHRAQTILNAEGINATAQHVSTLLGGFKGSARELIDWLEDFTLQQKLKLVQHSQVSQAVIKAPVKKTMGKKATVNGRTLTKKSGK